MTPSSQQIKDGIAQEIHRAIKSRFNIKNSINMSDVIMESAYCLAVNHKIMEKKMPYGTFDSSIMSHFFEGVNSKIEELFPKNFNSKIENMISIEYEKLINSPFCNHLINSHYDELYGLEGGNVI